MDDKQKSSIASQLGRLGGKASAAKLTPEERSAKARKAVLARYAKRKDVLKCG